MHQKKRVSRHSTVIFILHIPFLLLISEVTRADRDSTVLVEITHVFRREETAYMEEKA